MRCMAAVHSHVERRERIAEGGLPHEADDRGGDVLVLGIRPGAAQIGLGIALPVERKPQLLQLGAGQVARALHDDSQRGDLVDVVLDKGGEAVEEVLRLLALAIAARDGHHLDRGDARSGSATGALPSGSQSRIVPEAWALLHPCGHCGGRLLGEALERRLGRLACVGLVPRAGLVVKALKAAAQLDENLVADGLAVLLVLERGRIPRRAARG